MSWIVANIHRIMILSGVLTMPEAALRSTFGENVRGPVADIVVRNWGALIALVEAMLIYGARKPAVRPLALTSSSASSASVCSSCFQASVYCGMSERHVGSVGGVLPRAS